MTSFEFRMPTLGADMEKGTLLTWHVQPGDTVHRGQVIADVDTEKSAIEVEIWDDGVVDELCVPEGTEVPVGTVLARLTAAAGPATAPAPPRSTPRAAPVLVPAATVHAPAAQSPVLRRLANELHVDLTQVHGTGRSGRVTRADVEHAAQVGPGAEPPARVRSSPYARRLARERGVDPAAATGTGPGGAVRAVDVEAVRGPLPAAVSAEVETEAPKAPQMPRSRSRRQVDATEMRNAIGRPMARSKREIPHYYLWSTIDLAPAMDWLRARNAELPVTERLLPIALLLRATALAAVTYPDLNGFFVDGRHVPSPTVRLALPVALRSGGLVTPTLDAVEQLPLPELNGRLRDVATRARQGALRASDLRESTLTVTNLGDQGVEGVLGVIFPPQVALVGFGAITERPWAHNGLLGIRPMVTASLSADHRVSDGHRGGLFLTAIAEHLSRPEEL